MQQMSAFCYIHRGFFVTLYNEMSTRCPDLFKLNTVINFNSDNNNIHFIIQFISNHKYYTKRHYLWKFSGRVPLGICI